MDVTKTKRMKSIEEKAKAYDEAIKIIKDYYQKVKFSSIRDFTQDEKIIEKAFPELAESEDERVMRELIDFFGGTLNGEDVELPSKDAMERWVAWLKNQGEQKPAWSEEDEAKINRIVACLENLNVADNDILLKDVAWLKSLKDRYAWKPSDLPHWKKSTLPNDNTTGFNSDYFCYKGYNINYKELFEKLPKDD